MKNREKACFWWKSKLISHQFHPAENLERTEKPWRKF